MLANATLTLKPCFNKVKDVGKCDFDLEAFFYKVKDVGKCDFDLGATFLKAWSRMSANATLTLEPLFF